MPLVPNLFVNESACVCVHAYVLDFSLKCLRANISVYGIFKNSNDSLNIYVVHFVFVFSEKEEDVLSHHQVRIRSTFEFIYASERPARRIHDVKLVNNKDKSQMSFHEVTKLYSSKSTSYAFQRELG